MLPIQKHIPFTISTAQASPAWECGDYPWVSVHILNQGGSSTVTFQTSNDGVNWVSTALGLSTSAVPATSTTSASVIYAGPLSGKFFRLNITGIASGITSGVIAFLPTPRALSSLGGTGTGADQVQGTAAGNAAASGNPVQAGGIYESTQSTYDNNDAVPLHTTSRGELLSAISQGATIALVGTPSDGQTVANGLATRSQNQVYNGTSWDRARGDTNGAYTVAKPVTSGGLTATRVVTDTTGVIKGSAGQLYKLHSVRNANAGVRYLHLYDKATAPTLSTDTPVLTISLAASSVQNDVDIGGDIGVAFATGIAWAYTTDNIAIPATAGTSTELMFSGAYK